MTITDIVVGSFATVLLGVATVTATAAVPASEAALLKTTLTPLGAERAGSADGLIPKWTGGLTTVPPGFKEGETRPDFFPGEKPRLIVTSKNMNKYRDHLTDGEIALLTRYPKFSMEVYPTHRTAAAPKWVYENTFKNATRATLTKTGGVQGAYGGIPFPVLNKDPYVAGREAFWNDRLAWIAEAYVHRIRNWLMLDQGTKLVLSTGGTQTFTFPYYDPKGSLATYGKYWAAEVVKITEPPSAAGEAILTREPMDYVAQQRGIWQYLVGQRRVRRAPAIAYDTPDFISSGQQLSDLAFMAYGPFDEYRFKLLGKKEIFIPYNNNRAMGASVEQLLTKHFLNPKLVRWELHRVWVVEATLKPGRHDVDPRRLYYIDEDSWNIVLIDSFNAENKPVDMHFALMLTAPDVPTVTNQVYWGGYNLQSGNYLINEDQASHGGVLTPQFKVLKPIPLDQFTPAHLANEEVQ